jgi:hypothetical protein
LKVPFFIVVLFEKIEVDHQNTDGAFAPATPVPLVSQETVEMPSVRQTGQRIMQR